MCDAAGAQSSPTIRTSPSGESFIAWLDTRFGSSDVMLQAFDLEGRPLFGWPANGLRITANPGFASSHHLATSQSGSAFVCWSDRRSGSADVYAIQIGKDGTRASPWPADGTIIIGGPGNQFCTSMFLDDAGGLFFGIQGNVPGSPGSAHVQHFTISGELAAGWPAAGIRLGPSQEGIQVVPQVCSDGSGGMYALWTFGASDTSELYLTRITSAGTVASGWSIEGTAITAQGISKAEPTLAPDDSGGVVVVWINSHAGPRQVFATRFIPTGVRSPQWPENGKRVFAVSSYQMQPAITMDSSGGLFIGCEDNRNVEFAVAIQRLTLAGQIAFGWPDEGMILSGSGGVSFSGFAMAEHGSSAYVAWSENRDPFGSKGDIYLQDVLDTGNHPAAWPVFGTPVCTALEPQTDVDLTLTSDSAAIMVWVDQRSGGSDLYAALVGSDGIVPIWLAAGHADVEGRIVRVEWRSSRLAGTRVYAYRGINGAPPVLWLSEAFSANGILVTLDTLSAGVSRTTYHLRACGTSACDIASETIDVTLPWLPRVVMTLNGNPIGPFSYLQVATPSDGYLKIEVFDVSGRKLAGGQPLRLLAGHTRVPLRDLSKLGAGMYYVRSSAGDRAHVFKVLVLR